MNKVDIGKYNKDPIQFTKLVNELYTKYKAGITLGPEYAYFVNENLLSFFIRLARYKFAAKLLKTSDNVLEIGSGSGLGTMFLSQYCKHIDGLEIKKTDFEESLAICNRNNINFIHQDFFELELKNKYDALVCLDVIEHMNEETGQKLVAKIAKFIKDDGLFILGTPSIYSLEYQGKLSKASHIKCYDLDELLSVVNRYFKRTIPFSMNDEVVHTGHPKMAWYYFILGLLPQVSVK